MYSIQECIVMSFNISSLQYFFTHNILVLESGWMWALLVELAFVALTYFMFFKRTIQSVPA